MNRQTNKLNQRTEESASSEQRVSHQEGALEFSNPDELIRFDAKHTPLPPAIGERLKASAATLPAPNSPPRRWWHRLFGRPC